MASTHTEGDEAPCPCGSAVDYAHCCGRFIEGGQRPHSAEQLMRSRYCGFVLCNERYLLRTWHPDTRPKQVRLDSNAHWLGLSIRNTEAGGADEAAGTVEFVARYKIDGRGHRLHEISEFEKIEGQWYYHSGQHL